MVSSIQLDKSSVSTMAAKVERMFRGLLPEPILAWLPPDSRPFWALIASDCRT